MKIYIGNENKYVDRFNCIMVPNNVNLALDYISFKNPYFIKKENEEIVSLDRKLFKTQEIKNTVLANFKIETKNNDKIIKIYEHIKYCGKVEYVPNDKLLFDFFNYNKKDLIMEIETQTKKIESIFYNFKKNNSSSFYLAKESYYLANLYNATKFLK